MPYKKLPYMDHCLVYTIIEENKTNIKCNINYYERTIYIICIYIILGITYILCVLFRGLYNSGREGGISPKHSRVPPRILHNLYYNNRCRYLLSILYTYNKHLVLVGTIWSILWKPLKYVALTPLPVTNS